MRTGKRTIGRSVVERHVVPECSVELLCWSVGAGPLSVGEGCDSAVVVGVGINYIAPERTARTLECMPPEKSK